MRTGELGIIFDRGQYLFREGQDADRMYVIQEGQVEVVVQRDGAEVVLATRGPGDYIGEMAIFEDRKRSADVRALTNVRVLSVDRRNFLRRMNEDPTLAFHVLQQLSGRIRALSDELVRHRTGAPTSPADGPR